MLVSAKAFALKHEMTQGKELALYSAAVLQSLRPLTVYVRSAKMEANIPIDKASHLFFWKVCKRASFTSTLDIEGASKLGKTMYAKRWCHTVYSEIKLCLLPRS